MAFSDPISIKPDNSTTVACPRVDTGNFSSEYLSSDGLTRVKIHTTNGRRLRHVFRVELTKVIASTVNPSQNEEVSTSCYLTFDRPKSGYTNEELRKLAEGMFSFLTATEASTLKKLLGSES